MGYVFHFKIKPRFWQPRIRGPTPACLFLLPFCRLYIISPWIGTTQIHFVRGMYVCCMFVCLTGVIICLLCLATLGWAANSSEGTEHSIYIRTVSSLLMLSTFLNQIKLVYGPSEQSNMHSTLNFCPRPVSKRMNHYIREAKSLLKL